MMLNDCTGKMPTTATEVARKLCPAPDHKDADGDYVFDGYSDIPCICPEVATALDAYAAEHADGYFKALAAERDAALAKLGAAEACTTCNGQSHASGSICICGGSGRRSDETLNLRQLAQATQGQLDAAEAEADCWITTHGVVYDKLVLVQQRVRVLTKAAAFAQTLLSDMNDDDVLRSAAPIAIDKALGLLSAALAEAAAERRWAAADEGKQE